MRATIKDVAKLAAVSTATVSNVITNKKYVSPELLRRINDAMDDLNYKPNTIARSLKVNKTFNIGVMVPDITNPFFGEILKYAEKVANKENYQISFCNSDQNIKKERKIIDTFIQTGMDGLINVAPRMKDSELNKKLNIPMVIVDRPHFHTNENISFVYADNFKGGSEVAKRFVSKGFNKFICFAGPINIVPNAKQRLKGFQFQLKESGFQEEDLEIFYCDFTFESGYSVMKKLLNEHSITEHLTAFISSDIMAWGAMEAIKEKRLKIPRDISIIGYDNIFFSNFIYPSLTTVENPTKELGTLATQLLINTIENNDNFKGNYVILNPTLIERQSD